MDVSEDGEIGADQLGVAGHAHVRFEAGNGITVRIFDAETKPGKLANLQSAATPREQARRLNSEHAAGGFLRASKRMTGAAETALKRNPARSVR